MNFCEKCGAKLRPKQKFCERCGAPVASTPASDEKRAPGEPQPARQEHEDTKEASAQPTTVSSAEHERLQKQYAALQSRLKDERRNSKVNVFARLAFTRAHFNQVLQFVKDNALTMFLFYLLAVLLPALRWYLLIIFVLMVYLFPLLSNEQRFKWDEAVDNYLRDEEQLSKIRNSAAGMYRSLSNGQPAQEPAEEEALAQPQGTPDPAPQKASATAQAANAALSPAAGFSWNGEAIFGIIATVLGAIMYFMTKDETGSLLSQGLSVLQSGGLNGASYLNLWGFVMLLIGVPAVIGGIIKGATHHLGGGVLKTLGVLLAGGYGLAYSYVFANAAEVAGRTAVATLSGDTSLSDLENLAHLVQIIPWLVIGLYVIGILVNAVSSRQK